MDKIEVFVDADDTQPAVVRLTDDETATEIRMSLEDLNELGNEVATALDGHRDGIIPADD